MGAVDYFSSELSLVLMKANSRQSKYLINIIILSIVPVTVPPVNQPSHFGHLFTTLITKSSLLIKVAFD